MSTIPRGYAGIVRYDNDHNASKGGTENIAQGFRKK